MANKEDEENISNTDDKKPVPHEERARSLGHRSKEEWVEEGKDPEAWVDASEFLRRAPLYEGLHKANRTVKSLEKKLNMLVQHQEELVQAKVKQQLDSLKAEKKMAAKEHDFEKMVEIDEKIEQVKEKAVQKKEAIKDDSQEAFEEWKADNEWYEKDEDMFAYANGIGSKLEKEHPEWSPTKILGEVAKRTKKAFEWKSRNPNRDAPGKVASPNAGGNGASNTAATNGQGKMPTYNDLPEEAKQMYREFVKSDKNPHGFMTKEQYLKDYAVKAGMWKEAE